MSYYKKWGVFFGLMLVLLTVLLMPSPQPARAHAEYERSEPAADAVITVPPAEVHIWFTQELFRREDANSLEVFGPDGIQVDNGDTRIDDDDRSHLLVSLQSGLPDGPYTVKWRNLSVEDGHEGSGEFSFTVESGAAPGEAPLPTPPVAETSLPVPKPDSSSAPAPEAGNNLPCLSGLLVSALLLGLVWQQRSNP